MKVVQLSELREHLDEYMDAVRRGERIEIWDGTTLTAWLVQPDETNEERLQRLVSEGAIEPPSAPLPADFLTRTPIDLGGGVLEQFLEDRRTGR
jgi:antitoxin (DNA-binding transcriptional repressor) of toxin-antitoxin stability system